MLPNPKAILVKVFSMVCLSLLLFLPLNALSQEISEIPGKVRVGTMIAPPLFMKTADGRWEGLGIEIWQAVAQSMNLPFEYREYSDFWALLDALKKGEIDVIPSLPAAERHESFMDLSQSYLKSGLSIAVPAEGAGSKWVGLLDRLFSKDILQVISWLIMMAIIFGTIVWAFERRRNPEMFADNTLQGIGHGIWWSIVTMTTVGYGDKAPKTVGGRIVALIWMLLSIVFIANFTANITSSLTISELRGKVRGFNDLYSARVGSLSRSEASDYLAKHGIAVIPFESIEEGLLGVASKNLDAFVLNEAVLKYRVKKEFPGRVQVIPGTFDEYFISIALRQKSPLRKPINKALLKLMESENWNALLNRYIK